MATTNARIQFSTADEETWKSVNPTLREGELVITKKPSGKYRLYVGATGGSKFNDSTVVWDEELADSYEKNAAISANAAMASKSAAASSASSAAQSMNTAKENANKSEQNMNAAKTSADQAAQYMNSARDSSNAAAASSNSASLSKTNAEESMNAAKSSASQAEKFADNALKSSNLAYKSETQVSIAKNEVMQNASAAQTAAKNAKASEKAAAISAAAVSYATQEEVNIGTETGKIVSPKTLDTKIKAMFTGIVNKEFLSNIGYVTPHIGIVIAEIVGYTEEGHRRVKFTVQCACTTVGTNETEFNWLNFYSDGVGIATAYLDKYPASKFIKHELLVYPMIYCDVLTKEEKGYGAYVELSGGFVNLSRMYTADGKIGMYPNSMLKTGSCMFEFISDFTNE